MSILEKGGLDINEDDFNYDQHESINDMRNQSLAFYHDPRISGQVKDFNEH